MEATARLRFAKVSVRKARMILDLVRGQNVAEALDQLRFTRKAAAPIVSKLIDSAIANAQQRDDGVNLDRLYVKRAWADKAPGAFMIRWRPRAQGRATKVQKGVTHVTVVVDEREGAVKQSTAKPAKAAAPVAAAPAAAAVAQAPIKPAKTPKPAKAVAKPAKKAMADKSEKSEKGKKKD